MNKLNLTTKIGYNFLKNSKNTSIRENNNFAERVLKIDDFTELTAIIFSNSPHIKTNIYKL